VRVGLAFEPLDGGESGYVERDGDFGRFEGAVSGTLER
jgi:hypothetical protein